MTFSFDFANFSIYCRRNLWKVRKYFSHGTHNFDSYTHLLIKKFGTAEF